MDIKHIIQNTVFKQDFVLKERFLHAVIVVLCIEIDNKIHLVFQKRSANVASPGEIAFPGGKVEPTDLSLRETAIRETYEEMGIETKDFQIYHKLFRLSNPNLVNLDIFLGHTTLSSLDQMNPNPSEVESIFSIPLSYFITNPPKQYMVKSQYIVRETINNEVITYFPPLDEISSAHQGKSIWEHKNQPIFVYHTEYGFIWGITAQIIYQFVQMLESKDNVLASI